MIDLEKLKKDEIRAGMLEYRDSGNKIIYVEERYYNEDKTDFKVQRREYDTGLYFTVYGFSFYDFIGVMYSYDTTTIVYEDDYELRAVGGLDEIFEEKEDIIEHFVQNTDPKEYVIYNESENRIYKISLFFEGNTREKIDAFIEVMREQGHKVSVLKVGGQQ